MKRVRQAIRYLVKLSRKVSSILRFNPVLFLVAPPFYFLFIIEIFAILKPAINYVLSLEFISNVIILNVMILIFPILSSFIFTSF